MSTYLSRIFLILNNLFDNTVIELEKENLINAKKCIVGTLEDIYLADTFIRESYAKTLNNRKRLIDYFANTKKIASTPELNFDEEKFEEYKALCQ